MVARAATERHMSTAILSSEPAGALRAGAQAAAHAFRAGDLERAERFYRACVERCPDEANAWFLLGLVALKQGDGARF